jgi:hypothetical protein
VKPLLLLDLDNTLLKMSDFWGDFAIALARAIDKPDITFLDDYDAFTFGEGKLRITDYDRMLSNMNVTDQAVRAHLTQISENKSYLFDDAIGLLGQLVVIQEKYEVMILTFGQESFQQLKLDYSPELTGLPAHIIQDTKAKYIRQTFVDRTGVLVDDKAGQELPAGWTELHIDRTVAGYQTPVGEAPGVIKITDLSDVQKLI